MLLQMEVGTQRTTTMQSRKRTANAHLVSAQRSNIALCTAGGVPPCRAGVCPNEKAHRMISLESDPRNLQQSHKNAQVPETWLSRCHCLPRCFLWCPLESGRVFLLFIMFLAAFHSLLGGAMAHVTQRLFFEAGHDHCENLSPEAVGAISWMRHRLHAKPLVRQQKKQAMHSPPDPQIIAANTCHAFFLLNHYL